MFGKKCARHVDSLPMSLHLAFLLLPFFSCSCFRCLRWFIMFGASFPSLSFHQIHAEGRAAELMKSALKLDSSLSEPHYYLGNQALQRRNLKEAMYHLEAG